MKLTQENKLGEGSYGEVYKVEHKNHGPGCTCAAKIYKVPYKKMKTLEKLGYNRELKILKETSHPFILKYREEFSY
jgi:serine/threonine protein kinase